MLLALDTSARATSVALYDGLFCVAEELLDARSRPAGEELGQAVAKVVGGQWSKLDAYALSIGPGSFTGLRIGLSFLKGVAFHHPRPTYAVSTLEVIAVQALHAEPALSLALPLLDARRDEVYAAVFARAGQGVTASALLALGAHSLATVCAALGARADLVAAGDGLSLPAAAGAQWRRAPEDSWVPRARTVGQLANARRAAGDPGGDILSMEPVYLQATPAEVNASRPKVAASERLPG